MTKCEDIKIFNIDYIISFHDKSNNLSNIASEFPFIKIKNHIILSNLVLNINVNRLTCMRNNYKII